MNQESQPSRTPYEEQMLRLFANWQVFDEEIQATKIKEYRAIWKEIGEDRFALGVTALINNCTYKMFPSVAEFRGYVPSPRYRRDRNCPECQGTGWADAGLDDMRNHQVRRCPNPECLHVTVGGAA